MREENKRIEHHLNSLNPVKAYLLLLLGEKNFEPIKGKLWLHKEMFLLSSNLERLKPLMDFEPYFYGPHSERVDVELDQLIKSGLVRVEGNKIILTDIGEKVHMVLRTKTSKEKLELINEIKELLNDLSKDELLALIYFSFPKMAKDSLEIQSIKKKRRELALTLYRKGKISLAKAAEISGLSIEEVILYEAKSRLRKRC